MITVSVLFGEELFDGAGGGALLGGIKLLIEEKTGLRVTLAKAPLESVCRGLLRIIESEDEIGSLIRYRGR